MQSNKGFCSRTNFALQMFDADREKAVKSLIQFCKMVSDDQCLEMEDNHQ